MSVKVNIHPNLQHLTHGMEIVETRGKTVGECLNQVVKQFPDVKKSLLDKNGKLLSHIDIYVNDESAYPEELAKPVKSGDSIHIVLMIAGG